MANENATSDLPPRPSLTLRERCSSLRRAWNQMDGRTRLFVKLGCAWAFLMIVGTIVARIYEQPLGSLEHRRDFHDRQLDFDRRARVNNVVGLQVEKAFPFFNGRPSVFTYGDDWECDWNAWPCELVVRGGVVKAVFFHDYPYTSQPLPKDYAKTNARPYFERHPEYLGADWEWDNSTFTFRRAANK